MKQEEPYDERSVQLVRYLSGEMGPEEKALFEASLRDDPVKQEELEEYQRIWDATGSYGAGQGYDMDAEWRLMEEKLPGRAPGGRKRLLYYSSRVAAALVAGLIFTFAWLYSTRIAGTEQVVALDRPVEVELSDGTQVTLNNDSKLRYFTRLRGDARRVYLSGEAFFDVARDTLHPFVLEAGEARIEVLGTRFNVNAYRESTEVEVAVASGVVAVSARQDREEEIILRAGNAGTFNREKKALSMQKNADPNALAWKTKEIYFDHTPLQEAVRVINKVYHANLVIRTPEISTCEITVTFRDQTLEAVLHVLQSTLDLDVNRSGNRIELSGSGCME